MSFHDLLAEYGVRSGDDMVYIVLQVREVQGHEVAWLRLQAPQAAFSAWMLRCECHFTEGVGWQFSEEMRVSLIGPVCLHSDSAMERRQRELQSELAHLSEEDLVVELVTRAVLGEFVGEDGQRAGYGIGLSTVIAVCGQSPARTLALVQELVGMGRLTDLDQDVVGLPC